VPRLALAGDMALEASLKQSVYCVGRWVGGRVCMCLWVCVLVEGMALEASLKQSVCCVCGYVCVGGWVDGWMGGLV